MTEATPPGDVLAAIDRAVKVGRARSKLGTFYRQNHDDLAAKLRAGVGWRAVSAALVQHGLIRVGPAFAEEGEAGEKERDRVASLAKTAWQRAKGKATRKAKAAPAPAPVLPRVRPSAPAAPVVPAAPPWAAETPPQAAQAATDSGPQVDHMARLTDRLKERR